MLELRGNIFITGTSTFFLALLFLSFLLSLFCSSILFHKQQFLSSVGFCPHRAGSLGAVSEVYSTSTAQPLQAPCSEPHSGVSCSSQTGHGALPGISVAYFGVLLFPGHQMLHHTPLLPSASSPTDASLVAVPALSSPLYFKLHGDSLSPIAL